MLGLHVPKGPIIQMNYGARGRWSTVHSGGINNQDIPFDSTPPRRVSSFRFCLLFGLIVWFSSMMLRLRFLLAKERQNYACLDLMFFVLMLFAYFLCWLVLLFLDFWNLYGCLFWIISCLVRVVVLFVYFSKTIDCMWCL